MKIVITVYKNTGKFYTDAIADLSDNVEIYQTVLVAQNIKKHVPLLDGGFIQVRTLDGDNSKFFNHLYSVNLLKSLVGYR